MKLNNTWLSAAVKALDAVNIVNDGEYDKEFKGYISSFGASIIQSGLLAAVMFFENNSKSEANRALVIKAIAHILTNVHEGRRHEGYKYNLSSKFSDYLINNQSDIKNITLDVSNAATCLKLALRMFKEKGNLKNNQYGE